MCTYKVFREVPVPIYGEERVVIKEVTVPVEVIREVAVPVEHVVTKEVHVRYMMGVCECVGVMSEFVGVRTRLCVYV